MVQFGKTSKHYHQREKSSKTSNDLFEEIPSKRVYGQSWMAEQVFKEKQTTPEYYVNKTEN